MLRIQVADRELSNNVYNSKSSPHFTFIIEEMLITIHISGHFLMLRLKSATKELHVTSPSFSPSTDTCRVQIWIYQEAMVHGIIRIVAETVNRTQWLVSEIHGDDSKEYARTHRRRDL